MTYTLVDEVPTLFKRVRPLLDGIADLSEREKDEVAAQVKRLPWSVWMRPYASVEGRWYDFKEEVEDE